MKIKDLCEAERPREKMRSLGASSLGNSELLAILLRHGTAGMSALELSQRILADCDGKLSVLFNLSTDALMKHPGVGPCKAVELQAALELSKRFLQEKSFIGKKPVCSPEDVFKLMIPVLKGVPHEECWVLFLNANNHLIGKEMVSKGGSCSTVMDPGQIVRKALERNASGIILLHNHPAGNPRPSKADISQTEALHDACSAVGVCLMDHVIISDDVYFSFSEDECGKG